MNSEMQKRLYDMEVTPPPAVWEKLTVNIDEINADNLVSKKVLSAESAPPLSVWQKINSEINGVKETPIQRRRPVINLRRLAFAAVLIGIIATGWIVFQNVNQRRAGVAEIPDKSVQKTPGNETGNAKGGNKIEIIDSPIDLSTSPEGLSVNSSTSQKGSIASVEIKNVIPGNSRNNPRPKNRNPRTAQSSPVQYASLNTPLAKSFDRSIDDLSLVTSDQYYLTMVNANGRLVKIPAQLASLAPHLQDKPVAEDIYEVMFGEGTYWKETLQEWRKKVASVPGASGDAFTSFIELLKSVQDK